MKIKEVKEVNKEEMKLLFQALSQILINQDELKKHLGLNRLDSEYGWNDEDTMKLSGKCSEIANEFNNKYDDDDYDDNCIYF